MHIIIGGHPYSWPHSKRYKPTGIYEPFINKVNYNSPFKKPDLLILVGDIVWISTTENWREVDSDVSQLAKSHKYVFGNHDVDSGSKKDFIKERYGDLYSKKELNESTIAFFLDTNNEGWNIPEVQLTYIQETLESKTYKNVLLFTHQNIWWSKLGLHKDIIPNSLDLYKDSSNFYTKVVPYLESLESRVILFTGDLGAKAENKGMYEFKIGNIEIYASGMGNGESCAYYSLELNGDDLDIEAVMFGDSHPFSLKEKLFRKLLY